MRRRSSPARPAARRNRRMQRGEKVPIAAEACRGGTGGSSRQYKEEPLKAKIVLLLALPISAIPGQARSAEGRATEVVRKMLDEVMAVQTNPALQDRESRPKRRTEIKKIILRNFNFDDMAQHALGDYWNELNEAKRREFGSVFQDLFLESRYPRLVLDF